MVIVIATRRTETTLATEGNELKISTVRATIHGTTIRRVTTMKYLVNVLDNRSARMELINNMFVIISKNGL